MNRTTVRTLVLLVELLATVAIYQLFAWSPSATAAPAWLAGDDPNEVVDPNAVEDPNAVGDPQPESVVAIPWTRLDDEPADPNTPEEQQEPQPEAAGLPGM